jgi:hypothetical protein
VSAWSKPQLASSPHRPTRTLVNRFCFYLIRDYSPAQSTGTSSKLTDSGGRLSAAILGVSTITYLAMATGLGITFVSTHFDGKAPQLVHLFRQVYWARE